MAEKIHKEMNPSQKRQNELNPNIPEEFVNLTNTDIEFATRVYIEKEDPKDVYMAMGLDVYQKDSNCMGKYPRSKGSTKSEQQIQLGITRLLSKIKPYGEYIYAEYEKNYQKSDAYSRDVAIETCLQNILIARQTVEKNSKLLESLTEEENGYLSKSMKLSSMIAQGQKTILDYLKELNRLQHLYNKGEGADDKVTLVFNSEVER